MTVGQSECKSNSHTVEFRKPEKDITPKEKLHLLLLTYDKSYNNISEWMKNTRICYINDKW